jgi:hypothetical protein
VSVIALEPVDRVRVTVLVDNLTDPLLVDREGIWRLNWPRALNGALPRAAATTAPGSSWEARSVRERGAIGPVGSVIVGGVVTHGWVSGCRGGGVMRNP